MSNVFTFIRSGAFTKCANVYQGSFSSSSEVEGMQPTYEITIRGHELGVTSAASGEKPIITGQLEGLTKRRGKVYGSHAIAVIEKTTAFRQGWTIHDFEGNEYKWKVGSFSKCSWELYDMNKKIVATFDRTKWKMHMIGRLTIIKPVSQEFLAVILLTNKIVHTSVKKAEHAAANSGGGP